MTIWTLFVGVGNFLLNIFLDYLIYIVTDLFVRRKLAAARTDHERWRIWRLMSAFLLMVSLFVAYYHHTPYFLLFLVAMTLLVTVRIEYRRYFADLIRRSWILTIGHRLFQYVRSIWNGGNRRPPAIDSGVVVHTVVPSGFVDHRRGAAAVHHHDAYFYQPRGRHFANGPYSRGMRNVNNNLSMDDDDGFEDEPSNRHPSYPMRSFECGLPDFGPSPRRPIRGGVGASSPEQRFIDDRGGSPTTRGDQSSMGDQYRVTSPSEFDRTPGRYTSMKFATSTPNHSIWQHQSPSQS